MKQFYSLDLDVFYNQVQGKTIAIVDLLDFADMRTAKYVKEAIIYHAKSNDSKAICTIGIKECDDSVYDCACVSGRFYRDLEHFKSRCDEKYLSILKEYELAKLDNKEFVSFGL